MLRILLVLGLALASHAATAIDETGCRLTLDGVPSVYAECSRLTVAENPDDPDGRTLDLFVARVPALAATPNADPLVLISGGPGQSSVDLYLQLGNAFQAVRRNRDIILMDQRGTGRSADGLECPTPDVIDYQTAALEIIEELVSDCLAAIERDPRFFTTSIAVNDLEQLRLAMGIAEWNIYGVSYGTRVAQHYLRRYPDTTRTVILDGVVPPSLILGPDIAEAAQTAFDGIVRRCQADTACNERFGDIAAKFDELHARIIDSPPVVTRADEETGETEEVTIIEDHLLGLTRLMSYSAVTAALLPQVIETAYAGRYDAMLSQAEIFIGGTEQAISFAMSNSVACSEDVALIENRDAAFGEGTYLGSKIMDALFAICDEWPAGPVDADFKEPVVSERPVLLLSGSNDPATPARYAEEVMRAGLSNARHVVAESQGHGLAAIGCVPDLMESFIEAGTPEAVEPDCLDVELPTPFFLSIAGPAP